MISQFSKLKNAKIPWALIVSSFINKSGEMAISLLPMLLIDRGFSSSSSSLILGLTKSAQVGGLFVGGFMTDITGFRPIILSSFLMGFIGFTSLPFLRSSFLVGTFAVIGQFGSALFNPSARALVREQSGIAIKNSLAWLRTASNLGQVVSSLVAILIGSLGLMVPFLLDGITSLVALIIGFFKLKEPKSERTEQAKGFVERGFFHYSLALAFFYYIYELGFLSFSGFGRLALGNDGIRAFGVALLVNTFFCGAFAVPAAHFFQKPSRSLPTGFIAVALGMFLFVVLPKTILSFAFCSLIMTLGEIAFNVHSQSLLLVNSTGKSSKHYGLSLVIQSTGRLVAGATLFPLVLNAQYPGIPFVCGSLLFFITFLTLPKVFIKRGESA